MNENETKEKMDRILSYLCFTFDNKFDENQKDGTLKILNHL